MNLLVLFRQILAATLGACLITATVLHPQSLVWLLVLAGAVVCLQFGRLRAGYLVAAGVACVFASAAIIIAQPSTLITVGYVTCLVLYIVSHAWENR